MKYIFGMLIGVCCFTQTHGQKLKTANDSLSYALGQDICASLKKMEIPLEKDKFLLAISHILEGKKQLIPEEKRGEVLNSGLERVEKERIAAKKKASEEFFAKNKKNPKIVETKEGLQYEVLTEGSGIRPKLDDRILVHYTGKVYNGETFDDSYKRGEPLELNLQGVIEGWKIGIPLMREGAKYRFYIPYNLGYGERGSGPIPAFSTLIFDVELIDIKSTKEDAV